MSTIRFRVHEVLNFSHTDDFGHESDWTAEVVETETGVELSVTQTSGPLAAATQINLDAENTRQLAELLVRAADGVGGGS